MNLDRRPTVRLTTWLVVGGLIGAVLWTIGKWVVAP